MSGAAVVRVRETAFRDPRLNPVDKMVLHEWAWNTPEHGAPRVIRLKTYARVLGLSVNGVRKAVQHLIECGYLTVISVQVVSGPKLQEGAPSAPPDGDGGVHPVHPGGALGAPQRVHPVHPIKRKKIKGARKPSSVAPDPSSLTRFQRSQLLADRSLVVEGEFLEPGTPRFEAWVQAVRLCHA